MIHELTHAWQYHNNAASISYVGDAIWARVREDYDEGRVLERVVGFVRSGGAGVHRRALVSAQLLARRWAHHRVRRWPPPARSADQAFRFIRDNIRTGRN